jgi:glutamyl-tRNA synthetase
VRFAPSPTGKLHVGGARTAIYNWAFARANHGTFILRIDDTDPTRSTEENTQVILRAMKWLGLDWDEGPEVGGDFGPYWQTERLDIYRKAAERLVADGRAYYCFCTPEKLAADKKAAQERHDPFQGYQRTCRDIDPAEAQRRVDAGEPHTIRIKVPLDRGDVVVHDAVHGDVTFEANTLDDFIIFRSDGTPTYNFATVVDDSMMGITHVIRGDDHLSNTPRQIMVYEALGAPTPTFAHISMILGPDGKKLSKRHGATSVEEYRDAGYDSDAFVNYLALLGWALDGDTTIVPRDVLAKSFSLDHVSKNPATFDLKKLDWINCQYLQAMTDSEFARTQLVPQLVSCGPGGRRRRRGRIRREARMVRPSRQRPEAAHHARAAGGREEPLPLLGRGRPVRREERQQEPREGRRARLPRGCPRRAGRAGRGRLERRGHRRRARAAAGRPWHEQAQVLRRGPRRRVRKPGLSPAGRVAGAAGSRRRARPPREGAAAREVGAAGLVTCSK